MQPPRLDHLEEQGREEAAQRDARQVPPQALRGACVYGHAWVLFIVH